MFGRSPFASFSAAVTLILFASTVQAVTIDLVPVGNLGNSGELAGKGAIAGYGPSRISGAVDYEYRIGTFEVTAGQYTDLLNAVAGVDTYGLYNTSMWSSDFGCKIERYDGSGTVADPYQYRVSVDYADRPVNYVSWGDAARFCNWLHNGQPVGAQDGSTTENGAYFLNGATNDAALLAVSREADWKWAIPTEDEWYKAAYHKNDGATGNYFNYPTSNDNSPGRSLSEAVNPGNNANYHGNQFPFPIDPPYYTTLVGEFELSVSPYGTFDQGGNVWEWIDEVRDDSFRGLRGGAFNGINGSLRASDRYSHGLPTNEDNHIGFRVTSVAEPGSINFPPDADPNGPYTGDVGVAVLFDGTASTDDGTIVFYDWDFGDGNTGTGPTPSHTYAAAGDYTVALTVTDDGGLTDTVTTMASIADVTTNLPPVADAGGPYSGIAGQDVLFDGTGSFDPDGIFVTYDWDFGDGNTGTGPSPSHTYAVAGDYTVRLTVTDDDGSTDTEETIAAIEEQNGNLPPVADAGGPYTGRPGQGVQFDGSGSLDPDGTILFYMWDFGDGDSVFGEVATHTYNAVGTYTVTLTVWDNDGDVTTDTTTAEITDDTPPPPIGDAWVLRVPSSTSPGEIEFLIQIEDFGGILWFDEAFANGQFAFGIGQESGDAVFWMDSLGALFYGMVDPSTGTMMGIVFDFMGDPGHDTIFFGEQ